MDTHYKKFLWIALVLFSVQWGTAQERVSKTVEKNFPLTTSGELRLENKYGNITLTGWDQNKVAVKIDIRVNHRKRDNARDLLGRIDFEVKANSDYISVTSKISNKNTGWFADFFNRTNPIDSDRSHVQIDYEVFLPKKAALDVTNRFGDVIVENWSGTLKTLIEHGDLWIGENLNKADIILKFGKVRTRDLNYASLNLKNGELDMENSKSLRLNSDGTEINMGRVNSLEIYSNKDDIQLDDASTIYGSLKFSTLNLERLDKDVDLNMKIADFRINEIADTTSEIDIEQESADININIAGYSHEFNATLEQGVVRLPKSFENVSSNMLDKGKKLRKIRATYGKAKSGTINITGMKGIVTLRE